MISEERAEKAVLFFPKNADLVGQLKGQKALLEHMIKVTKAQQFLKATGTVAERNAIADSSDEYQELISQYQDCVTELETKLTLLKGAELTIDVYRTQAANSRKGHL